VDGSEWLVLLQRLLAALRLNIAFLLLLQRSVPPFVRGCNTPYATFHRVWDRPLFIYINRGSAFLICEINNPESVFNQSLNTLTWDQFYSVLKPCFTIASSRSVRTRVSSSSLFTGFVMNSSVPQSTARS